MADKEKLRKLMDSYGMLTDCYDIKKDFVKHVKFGFVRDHLNEISALDASDYTVLAIDKANEKAKENILEHSYIKDIQGNIIQIVLDDLERDMTDILAEYQKVWHHM